MASNPHFVLFPLMSQGHLIPIVEFGRLLARRGVIITIISTPENASSFESIIARDSIDENQIRFLQLDFPLAPGIPQTCQTMESLPCSKFNFHFSSATSFLLEGSEKLFEELEPKPCCIISDVSLPFTIHIARKFNIPRISFHGFNCFFNLVMMHLNIPDSVLSETDYFLVPGLPHPIHITKAQIPQTIPHDLQHYQDQVMEAEIGSYGTLYHTFEELESEYVTQLKNYRNRMWCIGPVSLCNTDILDKVERGGKPVIDTHFCLKWLDSKQTSSVIYVCFGSLCNLIPKQLIELALGLELSKRPFIWVIRKGERFEELEAWISESGFEERIKDKGILIRGWAPQLFILSHPSIGGFLTHCGVNGIQEGICSSIPMITWPLFEDQFINEKLVVEVLKIGVKVGVESTLKWGEEDKIGVMVKKEHVKEAIDKLMDEGEEAQGRRNRVKKFSEMAKNAMEEGGSSHLNITRFINDVLHYPGSAN